MQATFCKQLAIDLPIVQAPMGGASGPALAAAVSNAGGLGMLALSWHSLDAARSEIRRTRDLTDRPFGVNLVLAFPQEERLVICLEEGKRRRGHTGGSAAVADRLDQAAAATGFGA